MWGVWGSEMLLHEHCYTASVAHYIFKDGLNIISHSKCYSEMWPRHPFHWNVRSLFPFLNLRRFMTCLWTTKGSGCEAAWLPRLGQKRWCNLHPIWWTTSVKTLSLHVWGSNAMWLPYCDEVQTSPHRKITWRARRLQWEREMTGQHPAAWALHSSSANHYIDNMATTWEIPSFAQPGLFWILDAQKQQEIIKCY